MDQPFTLHETRRLFLVTLLIRVALFVPGFLMSLLVMPPVALVWLLREAPTLVVLLFVAVPLFQRILGRRFLAVALGLDVLAVSIQATPLFFRSLGFQPIPRGLAAFASQPVMPALEELLVEPFFFLLIPLVLFAWAYGRRGALLGSTWAALLHLGGAFWELYVERVTRGRLLQAGLRAMVLYMVPLIVATLAQRERGQLAELEKAHARLQRHASTMEHLAVSRERNRMAHDLHDTLAHSLAALVVQLNALRTLVLHEPAAVEGALGEAIQLAQNGLEESRKAIQALRADPLAASGLTGSVRSALQAFQTRTGVFAELDVEGEESELTSEEAQALYRIVEEALTNIERHASAQHARVRLAFGSDQISLAVWDDGVGFDRATVGLDHYGLTSMRERAALIHAALEVQSAPGSGTVVQCLLRK